MKYMRDNLKDEYGLLELQDKILEIAVYIDGFCEKNGIEYCLMGGSALGAKRHGGFIPWDDDLDIFMTPDNYEKFRHVFEESGDHEKFYLQEWGETNGMVTIAKIRMNNTTFLEESLKSLDIHHGIYIDIFILHVCPNNFLQQLIQCFWAKYVITKGLAIRDFDTNRHSGIRKLVIQIGKILPEKFLVAHGLKQVYKYRNKKTNYYCNFMGKAVFKKGIYKREWFDSTEYISFEKTKLKVSSALHEFLTERFGDYMKIPSPERIKYEQHADEWDFEKQYIISEKYYDEKLLI